jgi:hypothetical protein
VLNCQSGRWGEEKNLAMPGIETRPSSTGADVGKSMLFILNYAVTQNGKA